MARPSWDLTSTNSLDAAAEWLRSKSGALCVCIIRTDDLAIAGHPLLPPRDVEELLADRALELHCKLEAARQAAREKAARQAAKGVR